MAAITNCHKFIGLKKQTKKRVIYSSAGLKLNTGLSMGRLHSFVESPGENPVPCLSRPPEASSTSPCQEESFGTRPPPFSTYEGPCHLISPTWMIHGTLPNLSSTEKSNFALHAA